MHEARSRTICSIPGPGTLLPPHAQKARGYSWNAATVAALFFVFTLQVCANPSAKCQENWLNPRAEKTSEYVADVVYGRAGDVELKLNIAMPVARVDSDQRFPLLVFIHGGGWQTGGRNSYNGRIRKAAERGYVAATISHRLTAEKDSEGRTLYPWPAAIHDCKAAIRFLKTEQVRYRIDPERIGATGASSGGHLALLLGLTDPSAGLEGDIPLPPELTAKPVTDTTIHAVFNKSGPTELVSCYDAPVVRPFLQDLLGTLGENLVEFRQASPLNYLSDEDPPVMTIHGEMDHVVPVQQARLLDERMRKAGLDHRYLELSGEKHVFTRSSEARYWEAFYEFMDTQLRP